jgi:hypothetical protein
MPCPARPAGMRVKDSPSDPRYLKLFGKAVEQLARFDHDPTLDSVDVSLGGAWGEGSQAFPIEEMKALMDIYVRIFPNTKLLGQMSNPFLLHYIGEKRPIGWRADGTGSPRHMNELFPPRVAEQKIEFWKTAPISFESYWWISEWKRQGWDIDSIIEKTLQWHISSFNTKSFPIPYDWQDKIDRWIKRMGYRFAVTKATVLQSVKAGEKLDVDFIMSNLGVAPIYNKLPLTFILKGDCEYIFNTDVDICKCLPGDNAQSVSLKLPKDIKAGKYALCIKIGGEDKPTVKLAMDVEKYNYAYKLAEIVVE